MDRKGADGEPGVPFRRYLKIQSKRRFRQDNRFRNACRTERFRFAERKRAPPGNIPCRVDPVKAARRRIAGYGPARRYPWRQMSVCFGGGRVLSETRLLCFYRRNFDGIGKAAEWRKGGAFAANRLFAHNLAPGNGCRKGVACDGKRISEGHKNREVWKSRQSRKPREKQKQKAKDCCANRAGKADKPEKPVKTVKKIGKQRLV